MERHTSTAQGCDCCACRAARYLGTELPRIERDPREAVVLPSDLDKAADYLQSLPLI